jgi:oxygen-independent coproporphyrinogen-3 oxidase
MLEAHVQPDALGLYLSVPFCRSKCTFCNFASDVYPASELPRYVLRLVEDLAGARVQAQQAGLVLPVQVDTIYFGGGTPSILLPDQLRSIFAAIRAEFSIQPNAEITLEAAPAMLADDLLAAAVESGVTRISFGVQTFVDAEARAVGRLHTAAQALDDIARARQARLSVSVDLIAGLPGQTEASWQHSLATLGEAAPEHASIYMLEVDQDSRLGGEMLLGGIRYGAGLTPSDDAVADFYAEACTALAGQGLAQYEISNFARSGQESRHNQRYWLRRPYLGLGLDAHSMLRSAASLPAAGPSAEWAWTDRHAGDAVRFSTEGDLASYMQAGPAWVGPDRLTPAEEFEEAWFLGLRRNGGVSLTALRAEFGPERVSRCTPVLAALADDGLVTLIDGQAALTERGRMLSNDVFLSFLSISDSYRDAPESSAMAYASR